MATLNLRCRFPGGTKAFSSSADTTISSFRTLLESITGISANYQKISCGFPPKELNAASNLPISDFLRNGDTINVAKSDTPVVTVTQIAEPTKIESAPAPSSQAAPSQTQSSEPAKAAPVTTEKPTEARPLPSAMQLEGFESQSTYGAMVRRVMPDDNSCLFHTIGYVLEGQKQISTDLVKRLRQQISQAVLAGTFDEATLGKSKAEYARWILQPNSWGGALELSIFAQSYATEIYALDVINGIGSCFGEDAGFSKRVFVIFDGIHYDAIALTPVEEIQDLDVTEFKPWDSPVEQLALDFVKKENKAGHFTDTQNFQILCQQCNEVLKGEKGAALHAAKTGHSQFVEKR